MKKIKYFFIILLFSPLTVFSQSYPLLCSWAGGVQEGQGLLQATPLAFNVSNHVAQLLNVSTIPIYIGGVPNASATVINGRPVIVYNSYFLNYMAQKASQWGPISIIAHEYGHHVNFDTTFYGKFKHSWTKELQADFISGVVMARMGATIEQATRALRVNFSYMESQSHPNTPKRLDALAQGWYREKM